MKEEYEEYIYVPHCKNCRERPSITENGMFYCEVANDFVNDKDRICKYFEDEIR